jgi:hypothetical protein
MTLCLTIYLEGRDAACNCSGKEIRAPPVAEGMEAGRMGLTPFSIRSERGFYLPGHWQEWFHSCVSTKLGLARCVPTV